MCDTAWLGMTDSDWAGIEGAFDTWLAVENFDNDGQQRQALKDLTAPFRAASDPDQLA